MTSGTSMEARILCQPGLTIPATIPAGAFAQKNLARFMFILKMGG